MRLMPAALVTYMAYSLCYPRKDLRDGILALGFLTEHILRARFLVQTYRCDTSTLLTAIVLLLHHQVEFIETISPRAILLMVVVQWLQQAYHRDTTFML